MKENTQTRLEDIYQAFGEMEADFPESKRPITWRSLKVQEEADELVAEAVDDPTERQWTDIIKENTDVILTSFWLFREMGVTPMMALDYVLGKMIEVRERFNTGWYDTNPNLKPRDMTPNTPIAFAEGVDWLGEE